MGEVNRQVLLRSRPVGVAQADDFEVVDGLVAEPAEGEIVVRNRFLSVEPAMRGWIADLNNYLPPVAIGAVMRALAVGEVVASRHTCYAVGDKVTGWFGWQDFATVGVDTVVRLVVEDDLPLSGLARVLGINGATALLGLTKIGAPVAGQTVVVSTAAGGRWFGGRPDRPAARLPHRGHHRWPREGCRLSRAVRLRRRFRLPRRRPRRRTRRGLPGRCRRLFR